MIDIEHCRELSESLELATKALDSLIHKNCINNKRIAVLQKKLDRLTIAAQRCLNKFAHERIHAELKVALKEVEDIKE